MLWWEPIPLITFYALQNVTVNIDDNGAICGNLSMQVQIVQVCVWLSFFLAISPVNVLILGRDLHAPVAVHLETTLRWDTIEVWRKPIFSAIDSTAFVGMLEVYKHENKFPKLEDFRIQYPYANAVSTPVTAISSIDSLECYRI